MLSKIKNISRIITWCPKKSCLKTLKNHEILIENGFIVDVGTQVGKAEIEFDASGRLLTPSFIDSHTHPIFFSNRSNEFNQRVNGKSYQSIAESGGGIISSIDNVRNCTEDELFEYSMSHINYFVKHGTTVIEAKSGYGLTLEDELKSLRVIKKINKSSKIELIPTFMGAHDFPPEFKNNHDYYVDLICDEMLPLVAEQKLAEYCDVFCEKGYFTVSQSERILETAKKYGLKPRLHADEFNDSGAALLAAKVGAVSADHLMEVSDLGIRELAKNNVIATLLPGTTFFLGRDNYADGRKMVDMGCQVALATDFNPGSSTLQSMSFIISLAVLHCGLTIEEAFVGATFNGAKALNREKKMGAIHKGHRANLLFWDIESIEEIPYWLGSDRIVYVMKEGKIIYENQSIG